MKQSAIEVSESCDETYLHMLYLPLLQYRQSQQGTMFSAMAWSPISNPNFSAAPMQIYKM